MKACWPAPERNKGPILEVLRQVLPESGQALEVASGSGQHVAFFSKELPTWHWQPSDLDPQNLASIEAWVDELQYRNLRAPVPLDVRDTPWSLPSVDLVFCANMIHIAPWDCTEGLIRGSAERLRPHGLLILYGPFRIGGAHTAPSNANFDAGLRARDVRWGVRDLEQVTALSALAGLSMIRRVPMPANNQTLIFQRTDNNAEESS